MVNGPLQICDGLWTPSTRELLEACERRVAELTAALRAPVPSIKPVPLAAVVETYLADLRKTMTTDVPYARMLIEKLVGKITLRRDGSDLVAEVRGNLVGILGYDSWCGNAGAGSPVPMLPSTVMDRRIVA